MNSVYWTDETNSAINNYVKETCSRRRNEIFVTYLQEPFTEIIKRSTRSLLSRRDEDVEADLMCEILTSLHRIKDVRCSQKFIYQIIRNYVISKIYKPMKCYSIDIDNVANNLQDTPSCDPHEVKVALARLIDSIPPTAGRKRRMLNLVKEYMFPVDGKPHRITFTKYSKERGWTPSNTYNNLSALGISTKLL